MAAFFQLMSKTKTHLWFQRVKITPRKEVLVRVAEHLVFTPLLPVLVWASEPCAGRLTPAQCYGCGSFSGRDTEGGSHPQSPRAPEIPPLFPVEAQHLSEHGGALQGRAELLSTSAPFFPANARPE